MTAGSTRGLNNIPRNLGAAIGLPAEHLQRPLRARAGVPAAARPQPRRDEQLPSHGIRWNSHPFFVNPTSCGTKTVSLDARSWRTNAITSTKSTSITATGCENVPFDLGFDVDPSAPADGGTREAGKPSAQDVVLSYPRSPVCDDPNLGEPGDPDCWYEDDAIWQANLKRGHHPLPEGMVLNPAAATASRRARSRSSASIRPPASSSTRPRRRARRARRSARST